MSYDFVRILISFIVFTVCSFLVLLIKFINSIFFSLFELNSMQPNLNLISN